MQRRAAYLSAVVLAVAFAAQVRAADPPTAGQTVAESSDRQAVLAVFSRMEAAFAAGDATALAACWAENGEFIGPSGARADGREDIAKLFKEAFAARKEGKLLIHVHRFRLVNESLAMVDAVAEVQPPARPGEPPVAAFVLVKQGGQWLIAGARETVVRPEANADRLKDLEWLIGDWSSETSPAGITLRTNCGWTANRSFLIRKFKVDGKEAFLHGGTEVIGWDPRTSQVRSWVFDADGGFGESVWARDGNRWLIKFSGTLADGSAVSATHVLGKVDDNSLSLESRDRVVNGAAQQDIPAAVLKRQAEPQPAEPKPVEPK